MFKISIKNLGQSEFGTRETHKIEGTLANFDLSPEIEGKTITGNITLTKMERSVLAEADLVSELILICDRCLENFNNKIPLSFDREYFLDRKGSDEQTETVNKLMEIDLSQAIKEEIILNVPMKNLCKEKCKGICPKCGLNLNNNKCKCKEK